MVIFSVFYVAIRALVVKYVLDVKRLSLLVLLISIWNVCYSQTYRYEKYKKEVKPTRNVIVMIPDGTSIGVVSAARWFKIYNKMGDSLNIDPYICGTVKTHSSDAPIGDSAPTTSCYMTGMLQQSGNISIYPVSNSDSDLSDIDDGMAYQPLATLLEGARIDQNKSVGLVVTCEFPHATPADCSAHHYSRKDYKSISSQMAYQNLDVMFGGGNDFVSDDMKNHFDTRNIKYIKDDIAGFRALKREKAWALFGDRELPYDLDRDKNVIPSLEEMTSKAIDILSQNKNGFFLMVEGSKVDWAAHANDVVGCITEFIAFDNAVGAAIDFAKKDGNTTVIVLPDHGNSGFSIGNYNLKEYDKANIEKLFGQVSKYKKTAEGIKKLLSHEKPERFRSLIKEYTCIDITDEEYAYLVGTREYKSSDYTKTDEVIDMGAVLVRIMNSRTYFGFSTYGHTGEDVFLAAYHPQGDIPIGMNTNIEINRYLSDVMNLETKLPDLTRKIFAKHGEVFSNFRMEIDKTGEFPVLVVKNGNRVLKVPAHKSIAYLNERPFDIGSVTVYIDKNGTFYLSESLKKTIE
jgi:alkaline phosphatase